MRVLTKRPVQSEHIHDRTRLSHTSLGIDIYRLGVCLLEIGFWETLIKTRSNGTVRIYTYFNDKAREFARKKLNIASRPSETIMVRISTEERKEFLVCAAKNSRYPADGRVLWRICRRVFKAAV